jgi:hypothetical protein
LPKEIHHKKKEMKKLTLFVITFLVIFGTVCAEWEEFQSFSSRDLLQLPPGVEIPEGEVRFCGASGDASLASGETQCDPIKYASVNFYFSDL